MAKIFSPKNDWFSGSETGIFLKIQWKKKSNRQKLPIFKPIFDFLSERKRSRAQLSRAEKPSARAMARASSARTHHYYLHVATWCILVVITISDALFLVLVL